MALGRVPVYPPLTRTRTSTPAARPPWAGRGAPPHPIQGGSSGTRPRLCSVKDGRKAVCLFLLCTSRQPEEHAPGGRGSEGQEGWCGAARSPARSPPPPPRSSRTCSVRTDSGCRPHLLPGGPSFRAGWPSRGRPAHPYFNYGVLYALGHGRGRVFLQPAILGPEQRTELGTRPRLWKFTEGRGPRGGGGGAGGAQAAWEPLTAERRRETGSEGACCSCHGRLPSTRAAPLVFEARPLLWENHFSGLFFFSSRNKDLWRNWQIAVHS